MGEEATMKEYVDILGTRYTISEKTYEQDPYLKENGFGGYCAELSKEIVLLDINADVYKDLSEAEKIANWKQVLRHEIIHAFLNESGLSQDANQWNAAWPKNEEMVDWIAIQFPKILKAYQWCECL